MMKHPPRLLILFALSGALSVPLQRAQAQRTPAVAAPGGAAQTTKAFIRSASQIKPKTAQGKTMSTQTPQPIGKDGGATGAFTYSADPALAAKQRVVKNTIETYQKGLNSSDTDAIMSLFAPDAVVEWTDKPTFVNREALTQAGSGLTRGDKGTGIGYGLEGCVSPAGAK